MLPKISEWIENTGKYRKGPSLTTVRRASSAAPSCFHRESSLNEHARRADLEAYSAESALKLPGVTSQESRPFENDGM
jgi:hypothetical protein